MIVSISIELFLSFASSIRSSNSTIVSYNIYKLMLNFGKLYDIISDEEKKSLITYLIKEIQIYPNGESEQPLKSIEFNFPIYRDGQEEGGSCGKKVIPLRRLFFCPNRNKSRHEGFQSVYLTGKEKMRN